MIAVIADDITGGAEIAGIGLRYGLTVELSTRSDVPAKGVELWVISTDSRSMDREEAIKITAENVSNLKALGISEIFKKTDSVLRGHIVAELEAQLKEECKRKVVLCPANPQAGRKIINGTYTIDGIPLHKTGFSKDPDFPVYTSNVKEILGPDLLLKSGITIMDAATKEDLNHIAGLMDRETILAGSSAFFTAYLENLNYSKMSKSIKSPEMDAALFVCGSAFNNSRAEVKKAQENGAKVIFLSPLIPSLPDYKKRLHDYSAELITILNRNETPVIAIGDPVLKGVAAIKIKDMLAELVSMVISSVKINELVIEGGATASAIFKSVNFTHFIPTHEYTPGVVRMKVKALNEMYVTIKPGSYKFPGQVWEFLKN